MIKFLKGKKADSSRFKIHDSQKQLHSKAQEILNLLEQAKAKDHLLNQVGAEKHKCTANISFANYYEVYLLWW